MTMELAGTQLTSGCRGASHHSQALGQALHEDCCQRLEESWQGNVCMPRYGCQALASLPGEAGSYSGESQ
eukprot:4323897-Prorocentrum_lima.AAC.1